MPPKVRAAIAYIQANLTDPRLSVASVGRALEINSTYLAHLFARHMKKRMSAYIAACRVERAKTLLAGTTLQIKQVAAQCGFTNAEWFSQVFRANTGTTPIRYRTRHAGDSPAEA